jgi:hypothetical protein
VEEITRRREEHLVLVIQVDSPVGQAVEAARDFPEVRRAEASGGELRVAFTGARAQIADLNLHLVKHGVRVMELREEEVDLELAYLSVTGRDAAPAKGGA